MAKAIRRATTALMSGAALAVIPMAVNVIGTPAPSRAECGPDQIATDRGCEPPCRGNAVRDTQSGECVDLMAAISDAVGPVGPVAPVDLASAAAALPPLVDVPVNVALPGIGLPGIGIGVNLPPIGMPQVPQYRPTVCGPGFQTPIPMVGFTPCI